MAALRFRNLFESPKSKLSIPFAQSIQEMLRSFWPQWNPQPGFLQPTDHFVSFWWQQARLGLYWVLSSSFTPKQYPHQSHSFDLRNFWSVDRSLTPLCALVPNAASSVSRKWDYFRSCMKPNIRYTNPRKVVGTQTSETRLLQSLGPLNHQSVWI